MNQRYWSQPRGERGRLCMGPAPLRHKKETNTARAIDRKRRGEKEV